MEADDGLKVPLLRQGMVTEVYTEGGSLPPSTSVQRAPDLQNLIRLTLSFKKVLLGPFFSFLASLVPGGTL